MHPLVLAFALALAAPDQAAVASEATSGGHEGVSDQAQHAGDGDTREPTEEIVVLGRRGAARVAPEVELNAEEIYILRAHDIGEVLRRTMDLIGSDTPPVVIVNGRRMPNAAMLTNLPPDALERVEVLPREAAGQYGGNSAARVVNLVLQPQFRSTDAGLSATTPTAGGMRSMDGDVRRSIIEDRNITQFGAQSGSNTSLRGAERPAYLQTHPDSEDILLHPRSQTLGANIAFNRALGDWSGAIAIDAQTQASRTAVRLGSEIVMGEMATDNLGWSAGLSGDVADWSIHAELIGGAAESSETGLNNRKTDGQFISLSLDINRTTPGLPAGPISTSMGVRANRSQSDTFGDSGRTALSSSVDSLAASLSIPVFSSAMSSQQDAPRWSGGDATATLGVEATEADAGEGQALNAGLEWSPFAQLRLGGSWNAVTASASNEERFLPVSFGPPIIVYDFQTGESVEAVTIQGGNPDLRSPSQETWAFSASLGPYAPWRVFLNANFQAVDARNGVEHGLPATPEHETAFPDRFQRDADGRLISIDQRPFNLVTGSSRTLATALNFTLGEGDAAGGAQYASLWRININHSWRLEDRAAMGNGLAAMDRLSGDSGGSPQHELGVSLDGRRGRWGVNAVANWRSSYRMRRDSGRNGPDDVLVASYSTFGLTFSYALEQMGRQDADEVGAGRRRVETRIDVGVSNAFDQRPRARLGNGRLAPGYGRDDQDYTGRTVRLALSRGF